MAIRQFHKFAPRLWKALFFRQLSCDAKLLYLYFLTNEHVTSGGTACLPVSYIIEDTGLTNSRVDLALAELLKRKEIVVDRTSDEYFVRRWFEHNPPMNLDHYVRVQRDWENCHSAKVKCTAKDAVEDACGWKIEIWERSATARDEKKRGPETAKNAHLVEVLDRRRRDATR